MLNIVKLLYSDMNAHMYDCGKRTMQSVLSLYFFIIIISVNDPKN